MADRKFKYYNDYQNIILKEYGRNVQKIVDYIVTIDDKEKRTRYAYTLIELMRQLNPVMRDSSDYNQKLWDHLYIMSGFRLDVDSEYPMPKKEVLGKKPKRLSYNNSEVKFKHYGRNVELLIDKATKIEDEADREGAIIYIARLMKSFYSAWNKENIEDDVIWQQMDGMSGGKLRADLQKIKAGGALESQSRDWNKGGKSQGQSSNFSSSRNNNPNLNRRQSIDKRKKN